MKASIKALAILAAAAVLLSTSSCMSRMGVEPTGGLLFDKTVGSFQVDKTLAKDFDPAKLKNYRKFQTHKVVIPLPFTFGALSFGWGDCSTDTIMKEGNFKRLLYADYTRLSIFIVYTNYEITAYGE